MIELDRIPSVVDTIMDERSRHCYFVAGTRDRVIESLTMNASRSSEVLVDCISRILKESEIDDTTADPHDPIEFYR